MPSPEQIDSIHRLRGQNMSVRKIARHLKLGRRTVAKYLRQPDAAPAKRELPGILDPFKPAIAELLARDPSAHAPVIAERLRPLGFRGGLTVLKNHLRALRDNAPRRAYVRMEPPPGDRFEIDWGHFGSLDYQGDLRKLYCFALVECHSRRMYIEFTHSQCFETFLACHVRAFVHLGGVARELVYDNLATAVAEHDGNLVRFNPRFLAFARQFSFLPQACHVAAPWEKGKVERAGVGYVRQSFWPLRTFQGLADVNRQAHQWQADVANRRIHSTTRQSPDERFQPGALHPLPTLLPDCRESAEALVHKDIRVRFDANQYCVPHRLVGHHLTVKADSDTVSIFHRGEPVADYPRCWRRGQTFGADRFERVLAQDRPAAKRSAAQQRLVDLVGPAMEPFLHELAAGDRAIPRQVAELSDLVRDYGPSAVAAAIGTAHAARAFGADYVANILRQRQSPRQSQPRLELRDPALAALATDPLSLAAYDAFILQANREQDKQ